MKSLVELIDESILNDDPVQELDDNISLWSGVIDVVQKIIDDGSLQSNGGIWKLRKDPDFDSILALVKKIKPTKYKKSDHLYFKSYVGFQTTNGSITCVTFYDGNARWPKLRPQQTLTITKGIDIMYPWVKEYDSIGEFLDTRGMRYGIRKFAYECPPEIVKMIYDMVKSKY